VTLTGTMNGVITPVAIIFAPSGSADMSGVASRS
jgi:hypothetical protein